LFSAQNNEVQESNGRIRSQANKWITSRIMDKTGAMLLLWYVLVSITIRAMSFVIRCFWSSNKNQRFIC